MLACARMQGRHEEAVKDTTSVPTRRGSFRFVRRAVAAAAGSRRLDTRPALAWLPWGNIHTEEGGNAHAEEQARDSAYLGVALLGVVERVQAGRVGRQSRTGESALGGRRGVRLRLVFSWPVVFFGSLRLVCDVPKPSGCCGNGSPCLCRLLMQTRRASPGCRIPYGDAVDGYGLDFEAVA